MKVWWMGLEYEHRPVGCCEDCSVVGLKACESLKDEFGGEVCGGHWELSRAVPWVEIVDRAINEIQNDPLPLPSCYALECSGAPPELVELHRKVTGAQKDRPGFEGWTMSEWNALPQDQRRFIRVGRMHQLRRYLNAL